MPQDGDSDIRQATVFELQSSLIGAYFLSFALGTMLTRYVPHSIAFVVLLAGVVMHGWGIYRIRRRNLSHG